MKSKHQKKINKTNKKEERVQAVILQKLIQC